MGKKTFSLAEIADCIAGPPTSRIRNKHGTDASCYDTAAFRRDCLEYLTQADYIQQLLIHDPKAVLVHTGDIIYNLSIQKSAIIQPDHNGFIIAQPYVLIKPKIKIYNKYLVFLMNECIKNDLDLRNKAVIGVKLSLGDLCSIRVTVNTDEKIQKAIGDTYINQLRLTTLKKEQTDLEQKYVIESLKKYGI